MIPLGFALVAAEGPPIINPEDRFKHLFILGGTGTGKTTFFLNLIKNELSNALIVLDPNGDLAERVASLVPRERLLYITKTMPLSLNPLTRDYLNNSEQANELIEVINTAVAVTSPDQMAITVLMGKIIRNAVRIGISDIEEMGDFFEYPAKRMSLRDKYWSTFDDKDSKGWYVNREQVESAKRIAARLSMFYEDKNLKPFVLGKNQFDIPTIIKQKKVVVFNFYGFDDFITAFLGGLVANQIKSYYLHQATSVSEPLYFYVDEYNLFFNKLYSRFLAESRKYNISCNMAGHSFKQVDKQLASMILSNCYVKVCLGTGAEDAEIFAKEINIKLADLLKLKSFEAYIGIGKKPHKVKLYPPPKIEPTETFNFLRDEWIKVV